MKRTNFKQEYKLHEVCGNRDEYQYIYFKDGYAYASNSIIIIKVSLKECSNFSDKQIDLLNGKFIHKYIYEKIIDFNFGVIYNDYIEYVENDLAEYHRYTLKEINTNNIQKYEELFNQIGVQSSKLKMSFDLDIFRKVNLSLGSTVKVEITCYPNFIYLIQPENSLSKALIQGFYI